MDSVDSKYLFFFLFFLSFHLVCSSSSGLSINNPKQQTIHTHETRRDFLYPPTTDFPPTPIFNPVTTPSSGVGTVVFPPVTPTPTIVTVPSTSPSSNLNPPVTNPVTTTPDGSSGNNIAPAVGQSWCVAVIGMPDSLVQAALDYACGIGGADCSAIQDGGSCYNPNTLQYHASYAFNTYYQRNPVQTSCAFGGVAVLTNVNPSSGSCIFATATSSSTASPTMYPPTTAVPTTDSPMIPASTGSGMPQPGILNPANPGGLGGDTIPTGAYGIDPTVGNSSSSRVQPLFGQIIVTTILCLFVRIE